MSARWVPWTEDELGFLASNPNMSSTQCALALGRSFHSVRGKRAQLRNGWSRERSLWSEDELDVLRATPHWTAEQQARAIGRTAFAVKEVRQRLLRDEGVAFGSSDKRPFVGSRRLVARTCHACDLILDASWFTRSRSNGRWHATCNRCVTKGQRGRHTPGKPGSGAASNRALQAITLERATHHREPWTTADDEVLADPTLSALEKAFRLGRTIVAVRLRAKEHGWKSRVGREDPSNSQWIISGVAPFPSVPS